MAMMRDAVAEKLPMRQRAINLNGELRFMGEGMREIAARLLSGEYTPAKAAELLNDAADLIGDTMKRNDPWA